MEKKINIADLLKECPAGTPLWSPVCGECVFSHIRPDMENNISVKTTTKVGGLLIFSFSEHGEICDLNGECVLFPSKDHQTWEDWEDYKRDGNKFKKLYSE